LIDIDISLEDDNIEPENELQDNINVIDNSYKARTVIDHMPAVVVENDHLKRKILFNSANAVGMINPEDDGSSQIFNRVALLRKTGSNNTKDINVEPEADKIILNENKIKIMQSSSVEKNNITKS
jgi:hypothetical protein